MSVFRDKREKDRRKGDRRVEDVSIPDPAESLLAQTQRLQAKDQFRHSADRLTAILSELKTKKQAGST